MRISLLIIVLAALMVTTVVRNEVWRDDGSIWSDTIEKTPKNARAYNELGIHLSAAGKFADALRVLNLSLALDPYQPQVYVNIGTTLEKLNRPEEAVKAYRLAIQYDPRYPTAYYNLGALFYTLYHDREQALHNFLIARDLNPREPDVHQYLGMIYRDRGDIARAEEEFALFRYLKQ